MIIPVVVILLIGSGLAGLAWSKRDALKGQFKMGITPFQNRVLTLLPPQDEWPVITLPSGRKFRVGPKMVPHMGIKEAVEFAKTQGWTLPTKELVDVIYTNADLWIEPQQPLLKKFDFAEMNSDATVAAHAALNDKQIAGRPFKLLVGTHKDVVRDKHPSSGKMVEGIYGWKHLNTGASIQDFPSGHIDKDGNGDNKDYSQGLRPVVEVT